MPIGRPWLLKGRTRSTAESISSDLDFIFILKDDNLHPTSRASIDAGFRI